MFSQVGRSGGVFQGNDDGSMFDDHQYRDRDFSSEEGAPTSKRQKGAIEEISRFQEEPSSSRVGIVATDTSAQPGKDISKILCTLFFLLATDPSAREVCGRHGITLPSSMDLEVHPDLVRRLTGLVEEEDADDVRSLVGGAVLLSYDPTGERVQLLASKLFTGENVAIFRRVGITVPEQFSSAFECAKKIMEIRAKYELLRKIWGGSDVPISAEGLAFIIAYDDVRGLAGTS